MILQHLTIHGKYLGAEEYKEREGRHPSWLRHTVFFCPDCGTNWAMMYYTSEEEPERKIKYSVKGLPCGCTELDPAAASMLSCITWESNTNAALPRTKEYVLYELNRYALNPERYWWDGWSKTAK